MYFRNDKSFYGLTDDELDEFINKQNYLQFKLPYTIMEDKFNKFFTGTEYYPPKIISEEEINTINQVANNCSVNTYARKRMRITDEEFTKIIYGDGKRDKYSIPIKKDDRVIAESYTDEKIYITVDGVRVTPYYHDRELTNDYINAIRYNYIIENCLGKVTADILASHFKKYNMEFFFDIEERDFSCCINTKTKGTVVIRNFLKGSFEIKKLLTIEMKMDTALNLAIEISKFIDDPITVTYNGTTICRYYKSVCDDIADIDIDMDID